MSDVDPYSISSVEETAPLMRQRLIDKHGRTITDLRDSITDRCNYPTSRIRFAVAWLRNGEAG